MSDKRKVLYDALSKTMNLGSYDEYNSKLDDEAKRRALYDFASQTYNLGDYESFSQKLGPIKERAKEQDAFAPAEPLYGEMSFELPKGNIEDSLYYPSPLNEMGREEHEPISAEERSKQEYDMLMKQLGEFNAANGNLMDTYEAYEQAAKRQVNEGGFAIDTLERRYLDEHSNEYHQRKVERDELNNRIKNNSYFNQMRTAEANAANEAVDAIDNILAQDEAENTVLHKKMQAMNALNMNPRGSFSGFSKTPEMQEYMDKRADLQTAKRLFENTAKVYSAPINDGEDILLNFGKGFGQRLGEQDFWSMGIVGIADDMNSRAAFKKIQDKFGSVKEFANLTDTEIDALLTPSEQLLIAAVMENNAAQLARMDNTSGAYQAGAGAADSLMFMAQFLLTGGIGDAATVGTAAHKRLVSWLGHKIGSMSNGLAKDIVRGAVKLGVGTLESLGKAMVMTPLMPHTYANIADRMMSFDDNGELMNATDAIISGAIDSLIETWSESTGDFVEKILDVPGSMIKGVAKSALKNVDFSDWGKAMNAPMMKILKKGGYNGFLGEMGEEFIGNATRAFLGKVAPGTGQDPNALKEFATWENLLITAGSFAPMTAFGLGVSSAQYGKSKRDLARAQAAFEGMLRDASYTDDQIKFIIDELLGSTSSNLTPEKLVRNFSPLLSEIAYNDKFANNRTQAGEAAVKFMWEISKYRTFDGIYHKMEEDQKKDMLAEIQEATGREFWTTRLTPKAGQDGTAYELNDVRAVEFNDGRVAYVLGGDGTTNTVVYNDGQTGFLSEQDLAEGKTNGTIVSDATMSLNDYLTQQVARVRMTAEEQRMFAERNDNTAQVKARFPVDATVEMGTEEARIQGVVRQHTPDGAIVESPNGVSLLTWEELGRTIGIEVKPQTDAEQDEETINNLEIADLQRRRAREQRRAQRNAQTEATIDAEQEVDEAMNEGLEHPIPTKADGSVDQTAFWNESPARWAQWKTEQRQDGGAYASTYINNAINILRGQIAENEAAFMAEADFDAKDALEQTINQQKQRLAELQDLAMKYAPVIEAQSETNVSEAEAKAKANEQASQVMAERQKYEFDAEYQRRIALAKALAERVMILQEYFDAMSVGSVPVKVVTKQDYKQEMKKRGCDDSEIQKVTDAIKLSEETYQAVCGLQINGTVYIMAEYNSSIENGRLTYVHERQHAITKSNPSLIDRVKALGLGRDVLADIVRKFSNSNFYNNESEDVLADEILSFGLEYAYKYNDISVPLRMKGIPEPLINLLNEISDEQRADYTLANARRNATQYESVSRDSGENVGDQGEISGGLLAPEGVRSSEDSNGGAENGEPAEGGEEGSQTSVEEVNEEPSDKNKPDFRVVAEKPEDNLSEETKKELADKGLVMEGGVIMSDDYAELKRETGYLTPIEEGAASDEVRFSVVTMPGWRQNYLKYQDAEKRVVAVLEAFANRITANELVNGVIAQGKHKSSKKTKDGRLVETGPLRSNISYVVTFDLDTTCPRTFQYLNYVRRIERRIGRPLTQIECIQLNEMMRMYGQQIPCVYCYAENKRQAMKQYFNNYIASRHAVLSAETDEEDLTHMYGHEAEGTDPKTVLTEAAYKVFKKWRKNPKGTYNPTMKVLWHQYDQARNSVLSLLDMRYAEGAIKTDAADDTLAKMVAGELGVSNKTAVRAIEEIVVEWKWNTIEGVAHDDFTRMDEDDLWANENALEVWRDMTLYAKSASGAKNVNRYVPYTDELKNVDQATRDYINGMGGLRMHSTNDFRIDYVFDYFQFLADMAAAKMFGHTYTKSPEFVRIFGNSGYKINMSIAAYQDENGVIRPNVDEGFDWSEAKELRRLFPHAGTMLMATSDEQLQMALDSDWIDMCIPFHHSGLPKAVWYNMRLWTDYTTVQNERFFNNDERIAMLAEAGVELPKKISTENVEKIFNEHFGIKVEYGTDGKRVKPHFLPGPTIVKGVKIPGHNNDHQEYLRLCKEYGVKPRFEGIKVKDNTPEGGGRIVDITEHPRYMILVKETARTDTPQTAIQFNFDQPSEALGGKSPMDYAFDELEARAMAESDLAGGKVRDIYTSLKQDQFGIVEQFLNTIIKHKEETGEDYPMDYLTPESREWFLVQRKAFEEAFKDIETIPYHRNEYDEQGNLTKGKGLEREETIDLVEEAKKAQAKHDAESQLSFRITPAQDKAYMDAIEKGDMETAQKMVDAAARAAGYDSPKLYHGTQRFGFTKIDTSKSDDRLSFFATESPAIARTYSSVGGERRLNDRMSEENKNRLAEPYKDEAEEYLLEHTLELAKWLNIEARGIDLEEFTERVTSVIYGVEDWAVAEEKEPIDVLTHMAKAYDTLLSEYYDKEKYNSIEEQVSADDGSWDARLQVIDTFAKYIGKRNTLEYGNYSLYANTWGMLEVECNGSHWNDIKSKDLPDKDYSTTVMGRPWKTRGVARYAKEQGYKGVIFKNVVDPGGRASVATSERVATIYDFFDPQQQVKSADPVTYDNEGKVIPLSERFNPDNTDIRFRIGEARKDQMREGMRTKLTSLSEEDIERTISEIEKFGEASKPGGNSKYEKIAYHWVLKGSVILPEDNYKIEEAIKVAERAKVNPIDYNSPMELIDAHKEFKSKEQAIDPDTVKEFSNKTELGNGIVVYDVQDDFEGQAAVRKVIDTHWGEDANPWCLAARINGDLEKAKQYWQHYSKYPKRIAFKDGKLCAFFASNNKKTWWDRLDDPHDGIPYSEKSKDGEYDVTTTYEQKENRKRPTKTGVEKTNGKGKAARYDHGTLRSAGIQDGVRNLTYDAFSAGATLSDSEYGSDYSLMVHYGPYKNVTNVSIREKLENGKIRDAIVQYTGDGRVSRCFIKEDGKAGYDIRYGYNGDSIFMEWGRQVRFDLDGNMTMYQGGGFTLTRTKDGKYEVSSGRNVIGTIEKGETPSSKIEKEFGSEGTYLNSTLRDLQKEGWERADYPYANPNDADILRNDETVREKVLKAENDINEVVGENYLHSVEDQVMFRMRGENESAMEFTQSVVDEYKSQFNELGDLQVLPVNEETAERLGLTLEQLKKKDGHFDPETQIISIFANEDNVDSDEVENTIFHEDIHFIADFYPHMDKLGQWMWENASINKGFEKLKAAIESTSDEYWHHQEMLTNMVSVMLSMGATEEFEQLIPEEYRSIVKHIENEIGYDRQAEASRRKDRRDSINTEGATTPSVRNGEDSQTSGSESLTAEERRIINEYFPGAFEINEENDVRFRTSMELDQEYGAAWRDQQNEDGRHSTQVANTKSTYEKIGNWMKGAGLEGASILDASSGLGLGTQALREMGFQVDDVEPFPSENREAPTFASYDAIDGKYDVVISNAVLNVIPDDWRADVLHKMAAVVKDGGKIIINTRPASNISKQGVEGKTRVTLDSPSEILVKRGDRIAAYQKGFTSEELAEWIGSELGEGWRVEKATKKNSGISGEGTAVVIKEGEPRFRVTGTPTEDVVAEGVNLSKKDLANLAGDIFAALPEESRKKITDGLNGNLLGLQDAILQIPTSLAVKEEWSDEDKAMAEVVAEQMTKAVGKEMTRPFSASEALWTLYNAVNKSTDLVSEASRALVKRNLGFGPEAIEMENKAKDEVRFRAVGDANINATASLYNRGAVNAWTRLKESFIDMNASVEELVKAIEKASGKVAQGFENVLLALNQQSSKGLAAMESYQQKFLEPMFDEISEIMKKTGKKYSDVVRYVILKHGLERNEKMAKRDAREFYQAEYEQKVTAIDADQSLTDAEKQTKKDAAKQELDQHMMNIDWGVDAKFKELRKNDYSGISSMFYDQLGVNRADYATEEEYQAALMDAKRDKYPDLEDVEQAAYWEVTDFEHDANTDELWKRINAATKETLRQQYQANMISKDQYENLKNMFDFYVPLRGFADNTAEDMYTYYRKPNTTGYTKPILGAEGRKTEAESPFGWIASMAGSAIASNVKNEAKLALYYFVSNRPDNGVATISRTWFMQTGVDADGKKIFSPVYPPFTEDLSSDAAKQAYEDWQKQMRDLRDKGQAYESGQRLNLGNAVVNISDANKPEHIVNVKVGGKDYTILINGNPRAAQAINGDLNIEADDTYNNVLLGPWLRWLSSVSTSYNPEFWATNMMRDMLFTMMAVNIKEDKAYRRRFSANYAKAFKVISMAAKNESGTLGNSYIEQMYKDFVENGGVTGFTQIKDSETWEKEIEGYLKGQDASKEIQAIKDCLHTAHRFGESLEQVSRFAAFLTSREMGKSMAEAINDAKEITVNFNRKGSGKRISFKEAQKLTKKNGQRLNDVEAALVSGITFLAPISRATIMFFNASVQALNTWFKLWKANKLRSLGWVTGYAAIGLMNALIHALMDDDDDYLDMPQYERRGALMLGGNGVYFKWSLPQEMSAFYALGELSVETIFNRNPHQNAAAETAKIVADVLPINVAKILMEEGGWVEAMPSQIKPMLELLRNEDYKGDVIFNEQKWLSEAERERTPKWESAYKGTGRTYINISKLLNNLTDGPDLDEAGWINIHPESLEHVVESMTGGVGRTASKLWNTITAAISPEEEVTVKQFPFLNRILTINDDRYKNVHVNEVYEFYEAEAIHAKNLDKKYKKDKDNEKRDKLRETDAFKSIRIYEKYKKRIDKVQEKIKAADGTAERKELMKLQDELKKEMIKEISEL